MRDIRMVALKRCPHAEKGGIFFANAVEAKALRALKFAALAPAGAEPEPAAPAPVTLAKPPAHRKSKKAAS